MSDTTRTDADQALQQNLERAKRDAAELAKVARERGRDQLEDAKSQVADGAERIADAVERTAEQLDGDGDSAVSGYGRSLASLMRQLAGGIRERDIDEFATELSSFARQHPGAFLAGSVALGFGISRFLKASGRPSDDEDASRPYQSHGAEDPFDLDRDDAADTEPADAVGDDLPLPGAQPFDTARASTVRGAELARGDAP